MEVVEILKAQGPAACAELLAPVIARRGGAALLGAAKGPKSLRELTLEALVDTKWSWDADNQNWQNPLDHLPSTLKIDLLATFNKKYQETAEIVQPHQWVMVELLFRCLPVDLDLNAWMTQLKNGDSLNHVVQRLCPQMRELLKTSVILNNRSAVARERLGAVPQAAMLQALESLFAYFDPRVFWKENPRVLRIKYALASSLAPQNTNAVWENLQLLELSFPLAHFKNLSLSGANLEDMQKLKELHIKISFAGDDNNDQTDEIVSSKLVDVAQLPPALEVLGSNALARRSNLANQFIVKYGQKPKAKPLLLDKLHLSMEYDAEWSSLLSVRSLEVSIPNNEEVVKRFCSVSTANLETLQLTNVRPVYAYRIADALAAGITTLKFFYMCNHQVDLHRLLFAAPRLLHLKIEFYMHGKVVRPVDEQGPRVDASYFRRLETFTIKQMPVTGDETLLKEFYVMFLLNADWSTLDIRTRDILDLALTTVEQNPSIGKKLCLLKFKYSAYFLPPALCLAALLALRSPLLSRVTCEEKSMPSRTNWYGYAESNNDYSWFQDLAKTLGIKFELKMR